MSASACNVTQLFVCLSKATNGSRYRIVRRSSLLVQICNPNPKRLAPARSQKACAVQRTLLAARCWTDHGRNRDPNLYFQQQAKFVRLAGPPSLLVQEPLLNSALRFRQQIWCSLLDMQQAIAVVVIAPSLHKNSHIPWLVFPFLRV